ncbi:hypothetical protein NKH77_54660 [Streptomyces sp. M19]
MRRGAAGRDSRGCPRVRTGATTVRARPASGGRRSWRTDDLGIRAHSPPRRSTRSWPPRWPTGRTG